MKRQPLWRHWWRIPLVSGLLLSLSGCVFTWVNITTPEDGYNGVQQLAYGKDERQQLDIYTPQELTAHSPILVFFYGGAWQSGDKADYRFVAQALTERGYTVAIPDYRVYPEGVFPDFIWDGANAISALAQAYPEADFVLLGHSAGAHIAGLLAQDEQYLQALDVARERIIGWVGWSGPYDFLPLQSSRLEKVFSGADDLAATQPINYVSADDPPALLIQGLDDNTVIPGNTQNLAKRMQEVGVPVTTHYYPEVGHIGTVGALAPVFDHWSSTLTDTLTFLESLSNAQQSTP